MNNRTVSAGLLILALGSFYLSQPTLGSAQSVSNPTDATRTVSVNGRGKVSLSPDTAYMNLGVQTIAATAKEAQQKNNDDTQKVINALVNLGVAKKDIQTAWYNMYPQYDYSEGNQGKITGYQVDNNLSITIRSIDKVSSILDKTTELGVNNVSGVTYSVENRSAAMDQARELAAKDAKEKADKLGKLFNFTVGQVTNVSEYSDSSMPTPYMDGKGGGGMVTPPSQIDVYMDINVTYAMQ